MVGRHFLWDSLEICGVCNLSCAAIAPKLSTSIQVCQRFLRLASKPLHNWIKGRVLLGLFRNMNTRNGRYLCSFGSYSVHSAPDSWMNWMEGIRFTRNRQNTRSFGKILAGNPTRPLSPVAPGRHASSQDTSAMGIPFPDLGAFFSK